MALEQDVLEALWTQYRDGDTVYVIAHPRRAHAMTEMQAYVARSFLLEYADTLDPLWLSRARQLLEATRKAIASEGPAWTKGTVLDQVRSEQLVDAFPNTIAMVAEDFIRFALLANESAWLARARDILAVLPHYYDPATNRVAGGSVAGAPPVFDDVISAHLSTIPLLMLFRETRDSDVRALAEQFLAPRLAPADPLRFPSGAGIAWYQKRRPDESASKKIHWHHIAYVSRALQFLFKHTGNGRDLFLQSVNGLLAARDAQGWFPRLDLRGESRLFRLRHLTKLDTDVATTAQVMNLLKDAFTLTGEWR